MFVIFLSVSRVAFNYIASLINGLHKFTAIETGRCANMRIIQNATEPMSESENKREANRTATAQMTTAMAKALAAAAAAAAHRK